MSKKQQYTPRYSILDWHGLTIIVATPDGDYETYSNCCHALRKHGKVIEFANFKILAMLEEKNETKK